MPLCLLWSQLLSNSAINCIYGCSTQANGTPIHTNTHTPQSMITSLPLIESAYSVTRLSIAYMVAAHARTPIHINTHTTINDYHQGFRVESWALTYRCYICIAHWGWSLNDPSVHPFSPSQDLHPTLRPHVYNGVHIKTLLLSAVASLDKE